MASESPEHRALAAIMFTDIVGYTALTQRNEALALELLAEHRDMLRSVFPQFNGREIETIGDGFLVEFASALEAARCAIEIQRRLATRNIGVPPERRIQLRIGIHVGDVVHRDGKVMGDGVNIAARLQPLAEPGGICISVDVAHQVQHNLEARVVPLGAKALKNVEQPLEICRIMLPWEGPSPAGAEARSRPSRRVSILAAVAIALILGLGGWAGWFWWPRLSRTLEQPVAPLPGAAGSPRSDRAGYRSVAVLPFTNISPDAEDDYLSDGLTEELINALVQLPGLRVPARTSAFVFKDKKDDVRKIAELLNVEMVLEGSVRRSGNRLKVTAQLINATDGYHLWSETYDREVGDLLTMQEEIARQIAQKLQLDLGDEAEQHLARRPTTNLEAHEFYLRGLYWWNKRTQASLEKAIQLFEQAVDKDPHFAEAHAAIAAGYINLPEYAFRPTRDCVPRAEAAARKALALDPNLAEAHAALGMANHRMFEFKPAEESLRRAVELDPNSPTSHHWYSLFLRLQGRLEEATTQIQRARELDPLSLVIRVNVAECSHFSGKTDVAIQEFQRGLELDPNFSLARLKLGTLYAAEDRLAEALEQFLRVRALNPDTPYGLGEFGFVLARSGSRDDALGLVGQLDDFLKQGLAVRYQIAMVRFGLGDRDQTFAWLEAARLEQEDMLAVKESPFWRELRPDPRFAELLQRTGFSEDQVRPVPSRLR